MQTLKKIPGKALGSETIQGSFYVGTVEQPNPGLNIMKEIWKDIKGYKGCYQISNFGRAKSLDRKILRKRKGHNDHYCFLKGRILVNHLSIRGYYKIELTKNNNPETHKVHKLVWEAFGNKKRDGLVTDHIDDNPLNNNINNLQLLTHRENLIKGIDKTKTTSQYIGVSMAKKHKSWIAYISINGKTKYLGSYKNEIDASNAYKNELKNQK